MSKEIEVTGGYVAIVDDEDYEKISKYPWFKLVSSSSTVYARTNVRGKTVLMHRMILDAPPDKVVGHGNFDGLDNRRSNLELCTNAVNAARARKHLHRKKRRGATSQYLGVSWDTRHKKWVAQVQVRGHKRALGYFAVEEDAARAYDKAVTEAYGDGAWTNFLHIV